MPVTELRRLLPDDYEQYYALRLAGLIECPAAFTTDASAWRDASKETIMRHLELSQAGDAPILGAWLGAELVGLLGMNREQRPSVSHKASLWGWFVSPSHRGVGVGRALGNEIVDLASKMPDLRQIRAGVSVTAPQAVSILESAGFERFGLEPEAKQVDGRFYDQVYLLYRLDHRESVEPRA